MIYTQFVLSQGMTPNIFNLFYLIDLEFQEKIEEFTELEMEINGVKSRIAKAYIIIKKL